MQVGQHGSFPAQSTARWVHLSGHKIFHQLACG